jgi:amino acid transporter
METKRFTVARLFITNALMAVLTQAVFALWLLILFWTSRHAPGLSGKSDEFLMSGSILSACFLAAATMLSHLFLKKKHHFQTLPIEMHDATYVAVIGMVWVCAFDIENAGLENISAGMAVLIVGLIFIAFWNKDQNRTRQHVWLIPCIIFFQLVLQSGLFIGEIRIVRTITT